MNSETTEGRILGIDYGERRVGLAITDPIRITSRGHKTLTNRGRSKLIEEIRQEVTEQDVVEVVVGIPHSLHGGVGQMEIEVSGFAEDLSSALDVPVQKWSERFTSKEAHRTFREMGVKTKGDKGAVDRMAAAIMLRSYLDSKARMASN